MRTLKKLLFLLIRKPLALVSPRAATIFSALMLRSMGASVEKWPNYLSTKIWFDGGDYSLITVGKGATISSNVRILTHDWSPFTAARAFDPSVEPRGKHARVVVEEFAFVGTGAILLPGATIGRGAIVGAGSVVRGSIAPGSIALGNPAKVVGDTRNLVNRYYPSLPRG